MPKTKEEIISALKGLENGDEFVSGFNELLKDSAKNSKAIEDLQKQVKDLTTGRDTATSNYNKLADYLGLPVDLTDIEGAVEELKKNRGRSDADTATLKSQVNELKRNIRKLTESNADLNKQVNEQRSKRHGMIKEINLIKALETNKALNPAITSRLLRDNLRILDDDSVVFVGDDGGEVTVDEGVKGFLDKYPDYRANHQQAGAGGGGYGTSGGNVDYDKMDPAAYRKARAEGTIK